jgi:tetratricopeptide (TPR) repeat protein
MDKKYYVEHETETTNKINEAKEQYSTGKIKDAIDIVDNLLKLNPNDLSIYKGYAEMILNENNQKSLDLVNQGLYINSNSWHLLKLKAEILTNYYPQNISSQDALLNLNIALECIRKAKKEFEIIFKPSQDEIKRGEIANEGVVNTSYLNKRFEIENLESTILSIRNSVTVWIKTEKIEQLVIDTEKRLYKERTRVIELLGLFVAIFAFILSSVQIANKFELIDAILIIVGMGLVLMAFILALHLAITPEERMRKLFVLLGILIFTLFILPIVPSIIKGIKYYLHL